MSQANVAAAVFQNDSSAADAAVVHDQLSLPAVDAVFASDDAAWADATG
jgi:hypothetical protein